MSVTQVQTTGIQNNAVTSAKIPNGAVGTTEIADGAVTLEKIAADIVVRTSGDQTISGTKTFTGQTYFISNLGGSSGSLSGPPLQAFSTGNNSAFMSFHKAGVYAVNFGLDSDNVLRIGGWSAAANRWQLDMGGNMYAAGDVVAFVSDIRLKANIEPIQNALDKILSLSGFTYNFNVIGEGLGFDSNVRHSGVSAQEVQKILPEAVCPAPADDKYLTVKYDKLIPLLIEAIKEQNETIQKLEQRIKHLEG